MASLVAKTVRGRRYWQIVTCQRVHGKPRQVVLAHLGGIDALIFTAGIGENDAQLRAQVCAGLEGFGVRVDGERNTAGGRGVREVSASDSRVRVLVVPTNEEWEIARQSLEVAGSAGSAG